MGLLLKIICMLNIFVAQLFEKICMLNIFMVLLSKKVCVLYLFLGVLFCRPTNKWERKAHISTECGLPYFMSRYCVLVLFNFNSFRYLVNNYPFVFNSHELEVVHITKFLICNFYFCCRQISFNINVEDISYPF